MRNPSKRTRAVIYIRLSVWRGEADPSTSPETQEARSRAYAESKGWEVVDVIKDLDVSGSDKGLRLDRPGLQDIRQRFDEVDVVIAKLDRLARNVVDFNLFAEEARKHDVSLVSVAESLDLSTPAGRFVANILAAFAEMEAATIAERTTTGKRAAVVEFGRYGGNTAPYGYTIVPHPSGKGSALAVVPEEARYIQEAAEKVLRGASLISTAKHLNATGSKPHRAKEWTWSALRTVLVGDAVLGRVRYHGKALIGSDGLPEVRWEPILDVETSRRLRDAMARPSDLPADSPARIESAELYSPRRKASRLLSGILVCSGCGRAMRSSYTVVNGQHYHRYVCGSISGTCPKKVSGSAEQIERLVADELLSIAGHLNVVEERRQTVDVVDLAEVERAIAETTREMTLEDADMPVLTGRLSQLRARRTAIKAEPVTTEAVQVDTGETYAERWAREDVVERRRLVESALAGKIVLLPGVKRRKRFDRDRLDVPWKWAE